MSYSLVVNYLGDIYAFHYTFQKVMIRKTIENVYDWVLKVMRSLNEHSFDCGVLEMQKMKFLVNRIFMEVKRILGILRKVINI